MGLILEGFAGPGGVDEGLRRLGLHEHVVGVEYDATVCKTRRAAGHRTIRGDVAATALGHLAGEVEGVWLSPPCPDWSQAGKKAQHGGTSGFLVDEVPRWVLTLRPRWFACEQVPLAQGVWDGFAELLAAEGYSTWTGKCNAADYGVPQARQRSILIGSLDHTVKRPTPTHSKTGATDGTLFGTPGHVTAGAAMGWTAENEAEWLPPIAEGGRRYDQTECVAIGEVDPRWVLEFPATTIAGRGRLCHRGANANRFNGKIKSRNDGYNLTEAEGTILQDFPAGYPFQGNQQQRWQQIGDAVPPGLAAAVVAEAAGIRP